MLTSCSIDVVQARTSSRVATFPSRRPSDEGARGVGTIDIHLLGAPWIEVDRERTVGREAEGVGASSRI